MKITEKFYYMCVKGMITIIVIKKNQNGYLFYIQFYNEKKSRGKHLFESKKFKKLKLTDRNKVFKNKK